MAHILRRLGEAALQFRRLECGKVLPPILSRRKAMMLRRDALADGREWPYEHLVPGLPRTEDGAEADPYGGGRQVGHRRRERQSAERQQRVADAMARMPALVAAYRAARRVPWDDVSPADRLLMSARQIREKYVLRKLK